MDLGECTARGSSADKTASETASEKERISGRGTEEEELLVFSIGSSLSA